MAKETGLGDGLWVDGYDLSGDINSLGRVGGGPAALELTGINKNAYERAGGKRDGSIEMTSFFNKSAGQSHPVFKAMPTSDIQVSYLRGLGIGRPAASLVAKQTNYDPTRDDDANLTAEVAAQANAYGLEWGRQLTSGRQAFLSGGSNLGLDYNTWGLGSTAFGLQAYLHVFAYTGSSATVRIQESSDNGADTYADVTGGVFTVTGVGAQRLQTSRTLTVERWLRVSTSGTFSNLDFGVFVVKNEVAVSF